MFRRSGAKAEGKSSGSARVGAKTKVLVKKIREGEVAIINHEDLDTLAGETLASAKPAFVINAARSISGRYPNLGPEILFKAGIRLLDDAGSGVMSIHDGQVVSVDDAGQIFVDGTLYGQGTWITHEDISRQMHEASAGMALQLKAFAANTMAYVEKEADLFFDGVGVPPIKTRIAGRHVLVVVRGYDYQTDLKVLRPYIKEYRPLIIAVDGGADAVLDAGIRLDMIVGDMDSVSDRALRSGAEVVVHAYRDGNAPGQTRVEEIGVPHVTFPFSGTSEDIAMILADEYGASIIVAVGTHTSLSEFLDKGRNGMASTFLTRLRVGGKIVDAKGVSRLYRTRINNWQLFALVVAALFALGAAIATTATGQTFFGLVGAWWDAAVSWFRDLF